MRALLASSIGVGCTAALAIPLALPVGAAAVHRPAAAQLPGTTQSLPLGPLDGSDRALSAAPGTRAAQGLPKRNVRPFSLVGVVWDDAKAEFHGQVRVRTRAAGTGRWSRWQDLQTHNDDVPDLDSPERHGGRMRGSTAPLWVGDSDAVQVQALPEPASDRAVPPALPGGLRIELVDPGDAPDSPAGRTAADPPGQTPEEAAASAVNAELAPMGAKEISALAKDDSAADPDAADGANGPAAGRPFIGPRPRIITRAGWGADEKLRERDFLYTKSVKVAFVHHTASGNNYTCAQAPSVLRSIYRYHVKSSGWRDFGYNFAIDKCGTVYEGRAGGVAKAVMGAHTLGFNSNSMGIAVLGSFTNDKPPAAAVKSVAALTAWKLGLFGGNPRGQTHLVSAGSNKFKKGTKVKLNVISGHRDGFATDCPGRHLYSKLGTTRTTSARLQGR
ncbi:peptidoglycan recognition protein family protein [Streptomyces sp. 8N706]|uniref:peptidoglycan recognition protein family protein n=1 Tax=Streptomyces sp. 8N706 TaxID=3457416 RepID=UPI003FD3EF30